MKKQKVFIVTPLINEEESIGQFIKEVQQVVSKIKEFDFSFLFIDDGSNDSSWNILSKYSQENPHISALKLSRNFGSHTAWYAGLSTLVERREFNYVVLITIDLQDPPNLIPTLLTKIKDDVRVVWAVRNNREDSKIGSILSGIYYALVRRFALPSMPVGGMDFCAIDRKVVLDIVNNAEKNTSLLALIVWLGYPQVMIPYNRESRKHGASHWTFSKKLKLLIDTFVAFSYAPIRLSSYLGFGISGVGFLYAALIVIRRILYGAPIEGWSSLMLVILLLSGMQLIILGILAEYLWRTLDETRKRPMYLIDNHLNL